MPRHRNPNRRPASTWIRPLFILCLFLIFLLIARAMMLNHFFDGGRYNNRHNPSAPWRW